VQPATITKLKEHNLKSGLTTIKHYPCTMLIYKIYRIARHQNKNEKQSQNQTTYIKNAN